MSEQKNENLDTQSIEAQKNRSLETPTWLKVLETQSWQAELLISGLLTAGLFRLPDLFIHWTEGYLIESSAFSFWFLSMASLLILVAINILTFFFAAHLVMRAIWVALLGLNSVYPKGINVNSTKGAGPLYWKKAKEKYPNLSDYNLKLDQSCSLIFSFVTVVTIIMISISILIVLVFFILRFLISYFPFIQDYILYIGIGLYLLFTIFSLLIQYLAKKHSDNNRVERLATGYGNTVGYVFSLYVFQKPIGYISSILISNDKSKYSWIVGMIASFFLGFSGARQTKDSSIYTYFAPDRYIIFNNRPHHFFSFNYEDQLLENDRIFTPIIPSDIIAGEVLKVFIPDIEREKKYIELNELSFWKKLEYDRATKDSIYREDLGKYATFNQILVNDIEYPNLDFQYHVHANAYEEGVIVYIPTSKFITGKKNILEIRKNYFSKDGKQKIVKIPFYFEKRSE